MFEAHKPSAYSYNWFIVWVDESGGYWDMSETMHCGPFTREEAELEARLANVANGLYA